MPEISKGRFIMRPGWGMGETPDFANGFHNSATHGAGCCDLMLMAFAPALGVQVQELGGLKCFEAA
jgi:hypothetical protein